MIRNVGLTKNMKDDRQPLPGYEGLYSVTSDGRLFSERRQRFLAGAITQNTRCHTPYQFFTLRKNGRSYSIGAHRLVAMTFLGPIPKGQVVNHKDGNGLNNNVSNLEIVSVKVNCLHGAMIHYPENMIRDMCCDCANGMTLDDIAFKHGVAIETASSILSGNNYLQLTPTPADQGETAPERILKDEATDKEITEIARLYKTGKYRQRELVAMFRITRAGIRNAIRRGKTRGQPAGGAYVLPGAGKTSAHP